MGEMRERAINAAKYPYVINLDIDDQLLMKPDIFDDFVGLGWVESGQDKTYWLPGEERTEFNTIRSNFMISKSTHDAVPIPSQDFYIYEYIRRLYLAGASFSKSTNFCVQYDKHQGSLSTDPVTDKHNQARHDLRRLDKAVK
jgi:hypothetical protein